MTCGGHGGGSLTTFTTQKGGQKRRSSGRGNGGRGSGQNNGQNNSQTGQPRGGGGGRGRGGGRRGGGRNDNWQPKRKLCHVLGHTASTCYLWCAKDPQANVIYQETPLEPQGSHIMSLQTSLLSPSRMTTMAVKHDECRNAMDDEFNALFQNETWCLVPSQSNMNIIGCKWVIKQLDVHNAFLNGSLSETVYMKQPPGYIDKQFPDHCSGFIYVLVYIDDILVMGNDQGLISSRMTALSSAFNIRDLGEPDFFLGIETIKCKDGILLSQQRYMTDILTHAGMTDCKPLATPMSASKPIISNADLYDNATHYRSLSSPLEKFCPWAESVLHPTTISPPIGPVAVSPSTAACDSESSPPPPTTAAGPSASPGRELPVEAIQPVKRPRGRPRGKTIKSTVRTHEMHTRSRSRAPPSILTVQVCPSDPTCYTQAVKHSEWREAMDQKFNALLQNQTWQLVPSQSYMNIIGCKWIFRTKRKADGSIERHKARLVAKGFDQVPGQDFFDTFSLVVKPTTVRLLLSIALSSGWTIKQLDVHNVFLNGHLYKTVYMKQPPGYIDVSYPNHVYLLKRSLYGLKQAPRAWFDRLHTFLLSIGFQRYMQDILKRAGMTAYKSLSTPISTSKSIAIDATPYDDPTQYRSLAGALQYLTITRPDLSFAVNQLCQHMHAPTATHWEQLKRVLRYVKGTVNFGLQVRKSSSREIHAFSDSDWAGCSEDRKSTSGFAVFLGSNLVSWVCKKQRTIARSYIEAEYKALADACAEVIWIMSLLREICVTGISVPKLWCDNLGATYMCANPIFHARTKHVEIDYHFVRDKVITGEIQLNFISTKDQLADIFTKALSGPRFSFLRDKLQVTSVPCA
ncbi:PREDICTED: uncharacterized protein LOC109157062 [Ipomoea nil]|uniref:uncharacterized protein LOC109157062 n=1 Tax=Ipomoea nil TaxID=35883 RepID=UPI00090114D5|nr:PREDICTED: uncharacterized protein LOC109157062 [Ipomoea nil]